tara:strand:+ start:3621 stop:3833 length:213 start_codon:yes stop_codon:yes gene_type:complete
MSQLIEASQRLDAALQRLDAALSGHRLRESELQAALDEAKAETLILREVTQEVSSRLDSAIERLQAVLED